VPVGVQYITLRDNEVYFGISASEWVNFKSFLESGISKIEARLTFAAPKRCLVLDCDGVLWGGVIGEDGREGIKLSQAHLDFQRAVKDFKRKGIILAINSRNNLEDVEEILEIHG
ncbi:MAG: hypothetical protein NT066_06945, partial [Candidatus Omnitrophica bacterium]|nr:hypothetical protein [Candidatus Omnitrophota bacterium]